MAMPKPVIQTKTLVRNHKCKQPVALEPKNQSPGQAKTGQHKPAMIEFLAAFGGGFPWLPAKPARFRWPWRPEVADDFGQPEHEIKNPRFRRAGQRGNHKRQGMRLESQVGMIWCA